MEIEKKLNIYHQEIIEEIGKSIADKNVPLEKNSAHYIGTTKPVYYLRPADLRMIYRGFAARHPDLTLTEFVSLLDSLCTGETYNEFIAIGLLLEVYPKLRSAIDPICLDSWLEHAQGWAEVDVICQFNFTSDEMLADWEAWKTELKALAASDNVHKKRASLVLLTKPLRQSGDQRLAQMALMNVEQLKGEKSILVTKAVSWVLRAMIRYHRSEVEHYLEMNAATLPKIAIRETRNKLVRGVKVKTVSSERATK